MIADFYNYMKNHWTDTDLGRIEIHQHARARRLKITLKPDCIRITLPISATEQEGRQFLDSVRSEIIQKREKLQQHQVLIDEAHALQTQTFATQVKASDREKVFFLLKNNILHIEYPHTADPLSWQMQELFKKGIVFFLKKEAKKTLPLRLQHLARLHGFIFSTVKIQSSKTRWGSCSAQKSINLSYSLMLLPQHLADYVMLHELCHTVEINHGERFWLLMDRVTNGSSKVMRAELRNYHCI